MIRGQNLSSVWNRTINIQYTDRVSLSYLSGNLAKVFTRKSAPKPKKSLPANSTITVVPTTGGVPTPSPSEESSPPSVRPSVRLRGPSSASDVCPALWIHTTTNNEGRLTMILIIIIIIKITSPTNNLPSSTSQKWKIKKKNKVCVSVTGWAVVWVPPRWRVGGSTGGKSSPHQRRSGGLFVSPPCFSSSLPFQCRVSLPPSFFSLASSLSVAASRSSSPGSVALAGLAAHLSEVRTAAELELQYQRAVGHFVYIFAFWWGKEERRRIQLKQLRGTFTVCWFWPSDAKIDYL